MDVSQLFSVKGKRVLITGGAGMYGRQLVDGFCEAGARVFMASRSVDALEVIAAEWREKGADIEALALDLGEESSILRLRDQLRERAEGLDVLVNNAVLRPLLRDGYDCTAADFDLSMKVNATGLFLITRALGDLIAEGGGGSIVNIGSIHGMIAPDPSLYEGTALSGWYPDYFFHKSGMINFTRFMASYYGTKGVRCNCVSPGGYQTEKHDPRFLENYAAKTMLGRMANDDDLKGVVVFLASGAAGYITGVNLPVDAGYTAK